MELARLNLERAKELLPENVITRSSFDSADAEFKQAAAQADTIRATIAKKTIRAPFAGRLGLRLVNLGQTLDGGDPIVSLQSMDPIFANFQLPQQELAKIRRGLPVKLTTDALPGETIEGTITAVNPQVDSATRNVRVQATVANTREQLRPGMFVNVAVVLPEAQPVLTIPATAVLYAPYSDSVFIVEKPDPMTLETLGQASAPAVCSTGRKARRFYRRPVRSQGRRDRGEHRGVQAAQRAGRGGGQYPCPGIQPGPQTARRMSGGNWFFGCNWLVGPIDLIGR